MGATGLIRADRMKTGLRPVHPQSDLAGIADLIETCFTSTLDAAGRSAIQEMRTLSRTGPLLWLLARLSDVIPGVLDGFVWIEDARVVGNVSLSRTGYGDGWIIANVAVDPNYRRRGIARRLMVAALERVAQKGRFATLQVEANNPNAYALYDSLGFHTQRTFTRWRRPTFHYQPAHSPDRLALRRIKRREAGRLLELAVRVRPDDKGGLGWLRPTTVRAMRPPRWPGMDLLWKGSRRDFWGLPGEDGALAAALITEMRLGLSTSLFDLLVAPERVGTVEEALVGEAITRLGGRVTPLVTEHPADDTATNEALQRYYFRPERTLIHMLWMPD